MKNLQQLRSPFLSTIMAAVIGVSLSSTVMAAGIDVGVKAGVGADARVGASGAAQADGTADGHMSVSGNDNGNAQWQNGATRGKDRVMERMNPNGTEPEAELETTGKAAAKGQRSGMR